MSADLQKRLDTVRAQLALTACAPLHTLPDGRYVIELPGQVLICLRDLPEVESFAAGLAAIKGPHEHDR